MAEKTEILDIVALVQNNPLTKLSNNYGSKIIEKIQQRFKSEDQQLFVANFYCYLNYNSKTDFVINLDRIWKWLGYTRVDHCKTVLFKNFKENTDYKIENFAPEVAEAKTEPNEEPRETRGGHNREYTTLTINCFKKLCLKSRTEKANQIHDYYIGLEDLLNELVSEQTVELQNKLLIKDKENHNNLITNFKDKQVVYIIQIEENIFKFGYTKDIEQRFKDHKIEFGKDIIIKIIHETIYNREFEDMIKNQFKKHIVTKKYKKVQTELIQVSDIFTYSDLIKEFDKLKQLVNENLVPKLIKEITDLKIYIAKLEQDHLTKDEKIIINKLTDENNELRLQLIELEAKLSSGQNQIEKEKLELRKQEIDLKYNKQTKSKNIYTSEHRFVDGLEQKLCMGITCCEETEEGQWLNLEQFGKSAQNKDGYKTICKKCRSTTEKSYYHRQNQKMTPEELEESKNKRSMNLRTKFENNMKMCTKCNISKDLTEYKKNGKYVTGEDKYYSHCTKCINETRRESNKLKKLSQ